MIRAAELRPGDAVMVGNSLYYPCEFTVDQVTVSHECPDGRVLLETFGLEDAVETAGERLAVLRGRLDTAVVQADRRYGNPRRREVARGIRDRLQAQIDDLNDLGVVAEYRPEIEGAA